MSELQERITSTINGSITAIQAINLPFEDTSHASISELFPHLETALVISRDLASRRMYPAIDPLLSTSRLLNANIIGHEHYFTARRVLETLHDYKSLEDVMAILQVGADELSEAYQLTVARARRIKGLLTQPFHVSVAFHGRNGKFVPLYKTIESFKAILSGDGDSLPEEVFYMIGPLTDAVETVNKNRWHREMGSNAHAGDPRKRDADYIAEYASFRAREDEARGAAEASGSLYDAAGAIERFRVEMRIDEVDAEMDAFYAERARKSC